MKTFTRPTPRPGRPRLYTEDATGNVVVMVQLKGHKGNITRAITFTNAKVSDVAKAIVQALTKAVKK